MSMGIEINGRPATWYLILELKDEQLNLLRKTLEFSARQNPDSPEQRELLQVIESAVDAANIE